MKAACYYSFPLILALLFAGCNGQKDQKDQSEKDRDKTDTAVKDPHSFAEPSKAVITHLSLDADVNFEDKVIDGTATYDIEQRDGGEIRFDTRDLDIDSIYDGKGNRLKYRIGKEKEFLGRPLIVEIPEDVKKVSIDYRSNPQAAALQWLSPGQTKDNIAPFLFTQGQAILTRTWIPIQDSPGIRITYDATIRVPEGLLAVMSAENPKEVNESGEYEFKMEQPIPPYLMALAVGKLEFKAIDNRTGVYAEPSLVDSAASEFEDMDDMVDAAEELYGPYRWDRFDVLVLPPSFPFGGMENPRLTFATPTIIVGDKSLTSLIAHELAHSWSGNLVTNATWNDFWLNEGFTVYFEKRIMEELYGKEYAEMLNLLGRQDLEETIQELGESSKDTHLKLDLAGRNPDDGMTDIAYEKGYTFLRMLEEKAGRERFDKFLKEYFEKKAFTTVTTEEFVTYLRDNLLQPENLDVDVDKWVYSPGLPANAPEIESDRFTRVDSAITEWAEGSAQLKALGTIDWTTHEWLHFIRHLPDDISTEQMAELDDAFEFTASNNSEIQAAWYELALYKGYEPAYDEVEEFLTRVGRRKFLTPLYRAMKNGEAGQDMAMRIYKKARPNYHSVSRETMDKLLDYEEGA